jgi:hypothetical protein
MLSSLPVYRASQEERSIFWEVIVLVILNKNMYMYMCLLPNGFRDKDISLYISKIVDKKEILRTVSNTGIYHSSDKVGTVYLDNAFSKIPPSTSTHFATHVRTWRVARLYSVRANSTTIQRKRSISETVRNGTRAYKHFYLEWPIL